MANDARECQNVEDRQRCPGRMACIACKPHDDRVLLFLTPEMPPPLRLHGNDNFLTMSYLPVVWAGLFAYLGTSAGTCRKMPVQRSRLCLECAVSIARGLLPDMPCTLRYDALNWGGYDN